MTAAEFKKKWHRYQGKETSAYQSHFDDLCRLLGEPTPNEADPSGTDFFCFQKRVVKDAELFEVETPAASEPTERGFADVWKKGCFAWEYKGKKKNLDEAYKQLLRYRESLLNPPLLVVCDFDRYIIKTNFNGTVQEVHEFSNAEIDHPENLRILRALFSDPDFLKPQRTTAQVTKDLAAQIAEIAKSLQSRESVELADAKSRKEVNVAQKKNLRIARFLNRIVFCFFAEDTGLLPKKLFTEIAKSGIDDPKLFAESLEKLFAVMATGGTFGKDKIRYFNGHLFEEASVFELTEAELRQLADAGEADWQFIEPSIMGTLFERALEPDQRSQLGAHYTSEADIKTLVEPVLMQPFRREWSKIKVELAAAYAKGNGNAAQRERLAKFQKSLAAVTVLDPACGSGNFLYVSLQLLLGLEKEVIAFATQLGFAFKPQVSVPQLRAIEINPYAFELAQVSVQIGYLQWRRDNGFDNDRTPVLQNLDGFLNEDALLVPHFRSKAKTLKEAQAGEHGGDDALKFYTERDWPECDVIVGNPPFLGDKKMKRGLKPEYVNELRRVYEGKVPASADLCCFWFEKARELIAKDQCFRAGLLATQNIRGGASRKVLDAVKKSGDIFFAITDRDWALDGATVHVSMVGFDSGKEMERYCDGRAVQNINADLTTTVDVTKARPLLSNEALGFIGSCKGGPFDLEEPEAIQLLSAGGNPNSRPNSDLVRPRVNTDSLTNKRRGDWIIDTRDMTLAEASGYEAPFKIVEKRVKPLRVKNNDAWLKANWWRPQRMRPEMRIAIQPMTRFIATPTTSTHRIFSWLQHPTLPDHKLVVIPKDDDLTFGILHSRIHELWSRAIVGTQLREKESGQNYNVDTAVGTFPFPFAGDLEEPIDNAEAALDAAKHYKHITLREDPASYRTGKAQKKSATELRAAIAEAAQELNELRERWLNPPEWTIETVLEFPGSANGVWARYVVRPDKNGIGTVRYPRLEPRDPDCAAKLKDRTLTKLYNERPAWLDLAHKKLDAAVVAAYGFPADLTDEAILEKLLALNLERAASEKISAAEDLAEKKSDSKLKARKTQREKQKEEFV